MLNYHLISSQQKNTTQATFYHYLTLGSYQSYQLKSSTLLSLSIISIKPQHKFVVNSEKRLQDTMSVCIPITNNQRINQKIYKPFEIAVDPKYFEQTQKTQNSSLYIIFKKKKDHQIAETHLSENKWIILNQQLKISLRNIEKQQKIVNGYKKMLVLILSGTLENIQTQEVFDKFQVIYLTGKQQTAFKSQTQGKLLVIQFG